MDLTDDQEWLEFRCENCGGCWFVTAGIGEQSANHLCIHCGEETLPYASTKGMPEVDRERLLERFIQDRKKSKPSRPESELVLCVFCETPLNSENESKEHILPRWLRTIDPLPEAMNDLHGGSRRWIQDGPDMVGETLIFPPPRILRSKPQHELFATVSLCADCNNQWMSALELEVKPHLAPLVSGTSAVLPVEAHQLLARWACKVMIAFEQDDPMSAKGIPAQARDIRLGRVSRWTEVFVARWATPLDTMLRHSAFEGRVPKSYQKLFSGSSTYIGIGNVCLLVISADAPLVDLSQFHSIPLWNRIWPLPGVPVQLPEDGIDREQAELEDESLK